MFSPLVKNYKIEFVLDNTVRVDSRPFSLSAQSVPGGSGSSPGSGSSSSGHSKASSVGTPVQTLAVITACLVGRLLLLEVFMAAVFILNTTVGKCSCSSFHMYPYVFRFTGNKQQVFPEPKTLAQPLCLAPPEGQKEVQVQWQAR